MAYEDENIDIEQQSLLDTTLETLDQNNPLVQRLNAAGATVKDAFFTIATENGLSLSSLEDVEDEELAESIISELEGWLEDDPAMVEDNEEKVRLNKERQARAIAIQGFLEQMS